MRLKEGVILALTPEMAKPLALMDDIYEAISGRAMYITSARDGKHMKGSKHYEGNAVDIRIRYVEHKDIGEIVRCFKRDLGSDFDVVLEKDHIHVEYDP